MLLTKLPSSQKRILSRMLSKHHFCSVRNKNMLLYDEFYKIKQTVIMYVFPRGSMRCFPETSRRDISKILEIKALISTSKAWDFRKQSVKIHKTLLYALFFKRKKEALVFRKKTFPLYFTARESHTLEMWGGKGPRVQN